MNESSPEGPLRRMPDWAVAVVLTEGAAFLIALATTFIPGKTGSTWSPADLYFEDPSVIQRVVASFILVNLMLGVLAAVVWITTRHNRSK